MASTPQVGIALSADNTNLFAGLQEATAGLKSFGNDVSSNFKGLTSSITNLTSPIAAVTAGFAALAGAVAGIKKAVDETVALNLETNKLAVMLGTTLEKAGAYKTALAQMGISSEDFTSALARLEMRLTKSPELFEKQGIAVKDANGAMLPTTEVLNNITLKYNSLGTQQEKNAMLATLFGKSWQNMLPIMRLTSDKIAEAAKINEEFGLTISPESVARARAYEESMNTMGLAFTGIGRAIGDAVMPKLKAFADWIVSIAPPIIAGFKSTMAALGEIFTTVGKVIYTLGEAIVDVIQFFGSFEAKGEETEESFLTFGNVMKGVQVVFIGIGTAIKQLEIIFKGLLGTVATVITGVANVISSALTGHFSEAKQAGIKAMDELKAQYTKTTDEMLTEAVSAKDKIDAVWAAPAKTKEKDPGTAKVVAEKKTASEMMEIFKAELEARRVAKAKELGVNVEFYQLDKAEVLKFWEAKKAISAQDPKLEKEVLAEVHSARKAAGTEALALAKSTMDAEIVTAKNNYEGQKAAAEKYFQFVKGQYAKNAPEYKEATKKLEEIEQKHQEELFNIAIKGSNTQEKIQLKGLDEQLAEVKIQHQKHELSNMEFFQAEKALEEKRFAIQKEAADDRLALTIKEGNQEKIMAAQDAVEILNAEHDKQAKLTAAAIEGEQKRLSGEGAFAQGFKIWLDKERDMASLYQSSMEKVMGGIEQGMTSAISGILSGTMKMQDVLKAVWKDISSAIIGAISQILVKKTMLAVFDNAQTTKDTAASTKNIAMTHAETGAIALKNAAIASGSAIQIANTAATTANTGVQAAEVAAMDTATVSATLLASAETWAAYAPYAWIGAGAAAGQIVEMMASMTATAGQATALTALAQGTLVTSPTQALLGEAGPELVLPKQTAMDWMKQVYADVKASVNSASAFASGNYAPATAAAGASGPVSNSSFTLAGTNYFIGDSRSGLDNAAKALAQLNNHYNFNNPH